jgi:hypothetical protein
MVNDDTLKIMNGCACSRVPSFAVDTTNNKQERRKDMLATQAPNELKYDFSRFKNPAIPSFAASDFAEIHDDIFEMFQEGKPEWWFFKFAMHKLMDAEPSDSLLNDLALKISQIDFVNSYVGLGYGIRKTKSQLVGGMHPDRITFTLPFEIWKEWNSEQVKEWEESQDDDSWDCLPEGFRRDTVDGSMWFVSSYVEISILFKDLNANIIKRLKAINPICF